MYFNVILFIYLYSGGKLRNIRNHFTPLYLTLTPMMLPSKINNKTIKEKRFEKISRYTYYLNSKIYQFEKLKPTVVYTKGMGGSTDRSSEAIRILKTDLNSSSSLLEIDIGPHF